VLELFWTLARGFKVILQPEAAGLPTAALPRNHSGNGVRTQSLPEQILKHGVTHLQCTPSLARTSVMAPESLPALRSLRRLLLGGEALPPSLARQLHDLLPGRLYNLYGPTETTVWSAAHRVDYIGNTVPIGRPIANTEIYLLDRHQQLVPIGVPGELLIGGDGVARGYLNRPELTAEKFIRHPFNADPDARLYRTGDLARYRSDGAIEYLGRIDNQVKLRGHRIELGEIETVLARASGVREAVVALREDVPGDERLAAYLVASPEHPPAIADLRHFLREKLPSHMIPSAFVLLDRLPLTPNGKVDRRRLPEPENRHPGLETSFVSPRTELEKTIAKIWQELLRVNKVGLHDNFFDLGGHSLLMTQVISRVREAFQVELPVRRFFESPTIAALARLIEDMLVEEIQQMSDDEARSLAPSAGSSP
jgi:acyl-CoA synthetase (AMP-forming)/AMP-acid ligase II/acyl carrier protein